MKLIYILLVLSFVHIVSVFGVKKETVESLEAIAKKHAENGNHDDAILCYSKAAVAYYTEGELLKASSMKRNEAKHCKRMAAIYHSLGNTWFAYYYLDKAEIALSAAGDYAMVSKM